MLGVIQLVTHADVRVDNIIISAINRGILALVGIEKTDTEIEAVKLFNKILNIRIFPDNKGKTNLSLNDIQGSLLLVPQFTLVADTAKGTRPGFSKGMDPEGGKRLFEYMVNYARNNYFSIGSGQFGANMQVNLCNDGPMTFMLKV